MRPPTGWSSLFVLTLMLLSVAWSIQALDWTPGLGILTPVVLCSVLVGALLAGRLWLPASLAHGWSTVIGFTTTMFLATFVLPEYTPDPVRSNTLSTLDRMAEVRHRLIDWLAVAFNGGQVQDSTARLVFVLWMAMLVWLVGYIATWFLVRYVNWWGAVLPSGFALLANLYNAPSSFRTYLAFFLLCAFLLAVQAHVALQVDRWQRERIRYNPDIGLGFLRDGLLVAVTVIGFAWLAPAHVIPGQLQSMASGITSGGRQLGDRFNHLFPNLNYPVRGGGSAFGTEMPLGGSISLGSTPIFDAWIEGSPSRPRYWRMAVYDFYTGTGWRRTAAGHLTSDGLDGDLSAAARDTVAVTQTIKILRKDTRQLFAAPQPARFSVPVRVEVTREAGTLDVLAADAVRPLQVGESYQVVSHVSRAETDSLRQTTAEDPAWIEDRYLQLPASFPESVRAQADALTRGHLSRYDKAAAIESFLRRIPYSETINPPPRDRDVVEWFLFTEQQGYCDYYSSAFVVMARAADIPARVAAGYSADTAGPNDAGAYRQRESDAHTWPEVYFPGYGWIEFEPTAGDLPLERPRVSMGEEDSLQDRPSNADGEDFPPEEDLHVPQDSPGPGALSSSPAEQIPPALLLSVLLGVAFIGLGAAGAFVAWEHPFRGLTAAEGAFARVVRVASWLGLAPHRGDTPFEYGHRVAESVPEGQKEIALITAAYVQERFGRRQSTGKTAALVSAWQRLRTQFVRAATRIGMASLRRTGHRSSHPPAQPGRPLRR